MTNKERLSEDLKRFNSIIGYSVEGKKKLNEAPEDEKEGGDEFDFAKDTPAADEKGGEGDNADFDFGDEGSPEAEGGDQGGEFDFGGEEGTPEEGGEEMEDEFGTAGEFSAADDIEMDTEDEEVEEIDVTAIVSKSDEAKQTAELAAQSSEETKSYVKDLMDKFTNLEAQLSKMDSIMAKVSKIESDVKTPEEKLELRSLDSYPFNMKLTDYWSDKLGEPDNNYSVTNNEETFQVTQDDLEDYNELDIKKSFNPGIE